MTSAKKTTTPKKKKQSNSSKKNSEALVIPSCSGSDQPNPQEQVPDSKPVVEVEEEAKSSNNSNQQIIEETTVEGNTKKKKNKQQQQISSDCSFPTSRINRIIRSEGPDYRITQECIFLVNKATEQFLELFCKDVYAIAARDRHKAVKYKHLSSVVGNGKRYDFLSEFVPEKIKFEDALSERTVAET